MPVSHCLDYCSFVVLLKLGSDSSNFVFLFQQHCFSYSGYFEFPYDFYKELSICAKKTSRWNFYSNCSDSVDQFGEYYYLNSFNP